MKTVWIITRPNEVQAFHMTEESVADFVARRERRGQKLLKIEDKKGIGSYKRNQKHKGKGWD